MGFDPSGRNLVAHLYRAGGTNLWLVPLDGSEWVQLTDRDHRLEDYIRDAAWSPDGQQLVVSKDKYLSDAVLIEGFS